MFLPVVRIRRGIPWLVCWRGSSVRRLWVGCWFGSRGVGFGLLLRVWMDFGMVVVVVVVVVVRRMDWMVERRHAMWVHIVLLY